jgi:hypothetical protein
MIVRRLLEEAMGLIGRWPRLRTPTFDHYHPELHYMRGPGPKWHEKHGTGSVA